MTRSPEPHVVVLGAGLCGLSAARALAENGVLVTVLESRDEVGGLAAGRQRGDNFYDFGVHHLHASDEKVFADVSELTGSRLLPVEKLALIRFGEGCRRYPLSLSDLVSGLPTPTLLRSFAGLGTQMLANRLLDRDPEDAEQALIRLYGRPLYTRFFRDFTRQYWGVSPDRLSATFVRTTMPRLSAVDLVRRSLRWCGIREQKVSEVESASRSETLSYWPTGVRELPMAIAEKIRRSGGEIRLSSPVTEVLTTDGRVTAVRCGRGEELLECDACLSTVPLTTLVASLDPPPPHEVLGACEQLTWRASAVYGFLVRRTQVLDAQYLYCRDRIFHRVAEPKNSGLQVVPPDWTILLAEATCSIGDETWRGDGAAVRRFIADMEAEGLIAADDVAEHHVFTEAHAYPVYHLGFESRLAAVTEFLSGFDNLWSTGRQGTFSYPKMHRAVRMGMDAAHQVLRSLPSPA